VKKIFKRVSPKSTVIFFIKIVSSVLQRRDTPKDTFKNYRSRYKVKYFLILMLKMSFSREAYISRHHYSYKHLESDDGIHIISYTGIFCSKVIIQIANTNIE